MNKLNKDFVDCHPEFAGLPETSVQTQGNGPTTSAEKKRPSNADKLLECLYDIELWHSPEGDGYATVQIDQHKENLKIKSSAFRSYARRIYYEVVGGSPGNSAIEDVVETVNARASFDAPEFQPHLRLARNDADIYLDLCDAEWQAVHITKDGWSIVPISDVPVKFVRKKGMSKLPLPQKGGDFNKLRSLLNMQDEKNWTLFLCTLIMSFSPSGPYPVLVVVGEQGSGKSLLVRIFRDLVDPSAVQSRSCPREERDLVIAANNSWLISIDNVSHIQDWLSDAFCRLSTGGGFGTRELFADSDEVLFNSTRPILLNGISDFVTRGDLISRAVILHLPPIPEGKRRPESELVAMFKELQPELLGCLLDALSTAISRLPQIHLVHLPRLADFAKWATAAEPGLGLPHGAFMNVYMENIQEAVEIGLAASPLAQVIQRLTLPFFGNSTTLLARVNEMCSPDERQSHALPKTPKVLSDQLRRLAPALRQIGIAVEKSRDKNARIISIYSLPETSQLKMQELVETGEI